MIRHIVMWNIQEGETPRAKFERMAELKVRLLGLKEEISEIADLQVFFNSPIAPADNADVILICDFNSWSDLDTYQKHPSHVAVADYVRNIRQSRSAIDYEF